MKLKVFGTFIIFFKISSDHNWSKFNPSGTFYLLFVNLSEKLL